MSDEMVSGTATDTLLRMTTDIVAAYVGKNVTSTPQIAEVIQSVYQTLKSAGQAPMPETEALKPAVSIRKSVQPDYIVCLEDGRKLKMLKRHLRSTYNMTPDQYRAKWGLPADYPMVAPNYAKTRSDFAKKIGLGRPKASERKKGRKSKAA